MTDNTNELNNDESTKEVENSENVRTDQEAPEEQNQTEESPAEDNTETESPDEIPEQYQRLVNKIAENARKKEREKLLKQSQENSQYQHSSYQDTEQHHNQSKDAIYSEELEEWLEPSDPSYNYVFHNQRLKKKAATKATQSIAQQGVQKLEQAEYKYEHLSEARQKVAAALANDDASMAILTSSDPASIVNYLYENSGVLSELSKLPPAIQARRIYELEFKELPKAVKKTASKTTFAPSPSLQGTTTTSAKTKPTCIKDYEALEKAQRI